MSSKFQDGFASTTVRGIPLTQAYPGEVFYVSNSSVPTKNGVGGTDSSSRGSYNRPFATIDYAIGKCTASRGDIIAVLPGYTQDIAGAAGIALDVAGVAIVGLGAGSLRPQLTGTATGSTFAITAADCALVNLEFVGGVIDQTTFMTLSAAATGTSLESCWFNDSTDLNWLDCITLTTLVDDISFIGCTFEGNDAQNNAMITGVAHDRWYMEDCRFYQNVAQAAAAALIIGNAVTSSVWKNCNFRSNVDGALFIANAGANTGLISRCNFSSIDVAGAQTTHTSSGMQFFECYTSGDADQWGLVCGDTAVYS